MFDDSINGRGGGDVAGVEFGFNTEGAESRETGVVGGTDIEDCDGGSGFGEGKAEGVAETAVAAGDEGDFTFAGELGGLLDGFKRIGEGRGYHISGGSRSCCHFV